MTDQRRARILQSGLFDADFYLAANPDVAAAGMDPLDHYVHHGAAEGRDPGPAFSNRGYRAGMPSLGETEDPLTHFLTSGAVARPGALPIDLVAPIILSSGLFDADWYLHHYDDVRASGMAPLAHYLAFGRREGRLPGPDFPAVAYCHRYRDLLGADGNPLIDYVLNAADRDLRFSDAERQMAEVARLFDVARDPWHSPQARLDAASALVTNTQDRYGELIALFDELSMLDPLAKPALRMRALCQQLARRARKAPMQVHYDPGPNRRPGPVEDPVIAAESVLVQRRKGAHRAILVFTGNDQRVWMPVQIFQTYLPRDVHIVFLRDPSMMGHRFGLTALGYGYSATLAGLQRLLASLGVRQVYCIGSSTGGHAAVRYGLDLGARRVLSFVPNICDPDGGPTLADFEAALQTSLDGAGPPGSDDLREVVLEARDRPEVIIVYGDANAKDREQALRMTGIDGVRLVSVPDYPGHDVVSELISLGQLEPLIAALVAED